MTSAFPNRRDSARRYFLIEADSILHKKKRQRGSLCLLLTTQIELASAAIAVSAAKKQEDNDDPAGISVSASTSVVASETVVSAGTQKNNDPENTAAGTISESRKAIATPASAVTSTAIIASTSRSVVTASTVGSS